jgi:HK97 gp10 family phage protein
MASEVTIEGLADLERALAELPKATARSVLQRTLKKRAEPVREAWQAKAPKLTGHYERSIIVGPSSKLTSRQKRDAKREGKYFAEIHIGTSDPAGQQDEFGNSHQAAQPSARPAWEATKDGVLEGIGKDLGEEIEKAAARLARKAARLAGG